MKVESLYKPYRDMSQEEKLSFIGSIRHKREILRTAVVQRKKRAVKKAAAKTTRNTTNQLEKLLASMSPEERAIFIKKLEQS